MQSPDYEEPALEFPTDVPTAWRTFLDAASARLLRSLEPCTTFTSATRLAAEGFGRWAVLDLVLDGRLVPVEVAGIDDQAARESPLREAFDFPVEETLRGPLALKAMHTGRPQVLASLKTLDELAAHDPAYVDWLARLRVHHALVLPLIAHHQPLGTLAIARAESDPPFDKELVAAASAFAERAALAIHNAQEHGRALHTAQGNAGALDFMERLLCAAPIGLAFVDPCLRIEHRSESFAAATGLDPRAHMLEQIHPELGPAVAALCRETLATGKAVVEEEIVLCHNGASRVWRVGCRRVSSGGSVLGATISLRETTDRKKVEDGLRFLAEVGAAVGDSLDHHAALSKLARLMVPRLADWCAAHLVAEGDRMELAAFAHVDSSRDALGNAALGRSVLTFEQRAGPCNAIRTGQTEVQNDIPAGMIRLLARDAEELAVLQGAGLTAYVCVPLAARGRILGSMLFATCESRRRFEAEDVALFEQIARIASLHLDNVRLYVESQRSVRARQDLLAMVSHDLKSPLAIITLRTALLRRSSEGETGSVEIHADAIERAAKSMENMIRDLLDLARLEGGTFSLDIGRCRVDELLREAVSTFRPLAALRNVRLRRTPVAPALRVLADRERILTVFSNLLGNALKFTPENGVIRVWARREGGVVRFGVSDTGSGISPEELPHVFDLYFQGRGGARKHGTGLGLGIVRAIVESHAGTVGVESKPGEGSTFTFTLPVAPRQPRDPATQAAHSPR